ncbi:hypothetical protein MKX03_029338 [Papaver bracteatum]|nr:hypothetical protein MKX03_029338 [Papaver bracteatum]
MSKTSMFLGLFLFVLIAMPTSSSSSKFTCPAGQYPCRSNCGRSRCLSNY